MLVALIIYQLGACPCGCLEHNAWAQLLRLNSTHNNHHPATVRTSGGVAAWAALDEHTHDCTGEAGWPYFNNSRVPSLQIKSEAVVTLASTAVAVLPPDSVAAEMRYPQCNALLAVAAARCRPALQVYRL